MTRLPFAPLTEAVGAIYNPGRTIPVNQYGRRVETEWLRHHGNPIAILSELTGLNRRRLSRWTKAGVPVEEADRIAVALGLHVSLIWPEWFPEESNGA